MGVSDPRLGGLSDGTPQRRQTAALGRQFGKNLTELRGRVGLSQTATADRAGLHRTEVALVEHGQRIPRLDTLVKLAGAVEVAPCELLAGMSWRLNSSRGRSW